MSFANDLLIENPPRGNGWKKLFALTLVLMATALVASAQTITTLHSFTFDDGANPNLVTPTQGGDGNIYATTSIGGSKTVKCFCGTTFKMTPQGALTSVSFDGADGAIPDAGFLLGRNGLLYGTTSSGGASGNGEVFRLNSQTGVLTVLHSFAGSDGASPEAPLTLGPGGKYYGTTTFGGVNNFGTVFSITSSGTFKTANYGYFDTSIAATGVDKSKPGFMVRPVQSFHGLYNRIDHYENVIHGESGQNVADLTQLGPDGNPAGGDQLEYKVRMKKDATFIYEWSVANIPTETEFYFDFHGHTLDGNTEMTVATYKQATGTSQNGALTAPFDGIHGWFFQNQSLNKVIVRLKISGFYDLVEPGEPGNESHVIANVPAEQALGKK